MDIWTFELLAVLLESIRVYPSCEVKLPSPQLTNSLSFDVTEREETWLAGLGSKNLCLFSEYEPGM